MVSTEAEMILGVIDDKHEQNQGDIKELKFDVKGLCSRMDRLTGGMLAVKLMGGALVALLTLLIMLLTYWHETSPLRKMDMKDLPAASSFLE